MSFPGDTEKFRGEIRGEIQNAHLGRDVSH